MIALCIRCHPLADGDRWTSEQLREMKRDPYVKYSEISDTYGYLRVSFARVRAHNASVTFLVRAHKDCDICIT
jgi:hypothetical protein